MRKTKLLEFSFSHFFHSDRTQLGQDDDIRFSNLIQRVDIDGITL